MGRWRAIPVERPGLVLCGHALLLALSAAVASRIAIEGSVTAILPADAPQVRFHEQARRAFGSDDAVVVAVTGADALDPDTLARVDRLTRALARIQGVERVVSLTNARDPARDAVHPPRLVPQIPLPPQAAAQVRERLREVPLYRRTLVSEDFATAAIHVFLRNLGDEQWERLRLEERIDALVAAERGPGHSVVWSGSGRLQRAAVETMRRDLFRLTPLAALVLAAVLLAALRSPADAALALGAAGVSVVWTLALMVLAGRSLTLGTFVLPPLLLVVASSYAVHFRMACAGNGPDAARRAFGTVTLPIVISAATTAVGFGSLTVNAIPAIADLGRFSVVGIALAAVATLTLVPAGVALRAAVPAEPPPARTGRLLGGWARAVYENRRGWLAVWVLLAVAAAAGLPRIRADANFLSYFDPRSPVRVQTERIHHRLGGTQVFYVVVAGEPGTLRRWDVLRHIRDLQRMLDAVPGVTLTVSLVDYLELLHHGLAAGGAGDLVVDAEGNVVPAPSPRPLWEDPEALREALAIVGSSPETFRQVVNRDFSWGNVVVRTTRIGSREVEDLLQRIRRWTATHVPPDVRVEPTGNLVLLTGSASDIVAGQVRSLGLASGVIFAAMAVMFLSVRVGLVAMVPNIVPVVLFFGALGWADWELNTGTSLIATMALGLAVDSTIHYMTRLNEERRRTADQHGALLAALARVGRPVTVTSAALVAGFLVFTLSGFVPTRQFGALSAFTLLVAFAADMSLLPALMATTRIVTLWDVLAVRLGADPTRTIGLFRGLRPTQARIVVAFGELRRFPPGRAIVQQGQPGREMFVILRGETEVWARREGSRVLLNRLGRGEVFGEMGIVRGSARSADVVAATPTEVLVVDEAFLERLRRRYPRIASRVLLNLTRILSDRLEGLTDRYARTAAG